MSKSKPKTVTVSSSEFASFHNLSQPEASIILTMLSEQGNARKVGSIKSGKRGRPTIIWEVKAKATIMLDSTGIAEVSQDVVEADQKVA